MLPAMPSSSEMSSFTCSRTSGLPFQFGGRFRLPLSVSSAAASPASETDDSSLLSAFCVSCLAAGAVPSLASAGICRVQLLCLQPLCGQLD